MPHQRAKPPPHPRIVAFFTQMDSVRVARHSYPNFIVHLIDAASSLSCRLGCGAPHDNRRKGADPMGRNYQPLRESIVDKGEKRVAPFPLLSEGARAFGRAPVERRIPTCAKCERLPVPNTLTLSRYGGISYSKEQRTCHEEGGAHYKQRTSKITGLNLERAMGIEPTSADF